MAKSVDVVIVGAGFAGASTAYHLVRSFDGSVLILDKEPVPGFHASGRNASLVLQQWGTAAPRRAVAASRRFFSDRQREVDFSETGSLLVGSRAELERTHEPGLVPSEYWPPEKVREQVPYLADHRFEAALWTPSDGVLDISALLQLFLARAGDRGAELWLDCAVTGVEGAGPFRLATSRGVIETGLLVNAAGAWAMELAAMAGAARLPLIPWKRHLFVLDVEPAPNPSTPFIWRVDDAFYFRPESGGLLFSICDEQRSRSLEPTVEPGIGEELAEVVERHLPALATAGLRKTWSCFRTKTPDDGFVIGRDPELESFVWVAGLGGHGMSASWEVGRLAAVAIEGERAAALPEFDPRRFV